MQVGAFRTPEDAEAQRAKLSLMGVEAKVTEREQAGRTVFRVRVGPFDKKDDADRRARNGWKAAASKPRWCACSGSELCRPPRLHRAHPRQLCQQGVRSHETT